jgi:glucosamine 6-phosphate synthetase-like amidotransferase/phosphosugar isomerase protein
LELRRLAYQGYDSIGFATNYIARLIDPRTDVVEINGVNEQLSLNGMEGGREIDPGFPYNLNKTLIMD